HAASHLVPIVAGATFFMGMSAIGGTGLFVSERYGLVIVAWLLGSAASLTLNAILVPRWGAAAAAVNMGLSFAVVGCLTVVISQRMWPIRIPLRRLAGALGIVVCVGAACAFPWSERP